jgi:hypothetical protein
MMKRQLDAHPRSEGSYWQASGSPAAALVLDVALSLLPVTGLSYRLQYRLSRPRPAEPTPVK